MSKISTRNQKNAQEIMNHIPLKETSWGGEGFSKGIPPSPLRIKCTKEVKHGRQINKNN
jgi:hypothetical protein